MAEFALLQSLALRAQSAHSLWHELWTQYDEEKWDMRHFTVNKLVRYMKIRIWECNLAFPKVIVAFPMAMLVFPKVIMAFKQFALMDVWCPYCLCQVKRETLYQLLYLGISAFRHAGKRIPWLSDLLRVEIAAYSFILLLLWDNRVRSVTKRFDVN